MKNLQAALSALRASLGDAAIDEDPRRCLKASRDYFWMSPILNPILSNRPPAAAIVQPASSEEVATALRIAYEHAIPITPRGKGTGNYGQAVPYDGGIVLDLNGLNRVIDVEDEWITAESGCNFDQLELAANCSGQELQIIPSTTKSSLGGFLGGGAGGAGSVEHGFLWNNFVDWLEILPCTASPKPFRVYGPECYDYLHAFGATGIITQARVRLRPRRDWTALYFSFDATNLKGAAHAAKAFVHLPVIPRLNSFSLPGVVELMPPHPGMPSGRISARPMADSSTILECIRIAEKHGGRFEAEQPDGLDNLHKLSYNHVTLRAKQKRPDFCHLQVAGDALIERTDEILSILPESSLHMECRLIGDKYSFGGLLLSRFVNQGTMAAAIVTLRSLGLAVINVHSHQLGEGHLPTLEGVHRAREKNDPKGLLNSGRVPHFEHA
jgi:hypothetical protein